VADFGENGEGFTGRTAVEAGGTVEYRLGEAQVGLGRCLFLCLHPRWKYQVVSTNVNKIIKTQQYYFFFPILISTNYESVLLANVRIFQVYLLVRTQHGM
jgi:hypothetical protein